MEDSGPHPISEFPEPPEVIPFPGGPVILNTIDPGPMRAVAMRAPTGGGFRPVSQVLPSDCRCTRYNGVCACEPPPYVAPLPIPWHLRLWRWLTRWT